MRSGGQIRPICATHISDTMINARLAAFLEVRALRFTVSVRPLDSSQLVAGQAGCSIREHFEALMEENVRDETASDANARVCRPAVITGVPFENSSCRKRKRLRGAELAMFAQRSDIIMMRQPVRARFMPIANNRHLT